MDQARWLVVASVVFFMVATLTILNKFNAPDATGQTAIEKSVEKTAARSKGKAQRSKASPTAWQEPTSVTFTRPPSHVFSVENPVSFKEENKEFNNKGKILE